LTTTFSFTGVPTALGDSEARAAAERALSLAPDNSDLVLLAARMETARGRLDEGIAGLRRAAPEVISTSQRFTPIPPTLEAVPL